MKTRKTKILFLTAVVIILALTVSVATNIGKSKTEITKNAEPKTAAEYDIFSDNAIVYGIEDLKIVDLKMVINHMDFPDGSTVYGFDIYVNTDGYKLDADGYSLKPVLPDTNNLNMYSSNSRRNIPQETYPAGTFNIASDLLDEAGCLKDSVGKTYDIKLELYKGDKMLDTKTFTVLCEEGNIE